MSEQKKNMFVRERDFGAQWHNYLGHIMDILEQENK